MFSTWYEDKFNGIWIKNSRPELGDKFIIRNVKLYAQAPKYK